jgi:hypothetical protein
MSSISAFFFNCINASLTNHGPLENKGRSMLDAMFITGDDGTRTDQTDYPAYYFSF